MNDDNYMVVTKAEYTELVEKAERIEAVKRLIKDGDYFAIQAIYAVLGIELPKTKKAAE